ncbi:metal-dependent hydrolase [Pseudofrankia inefficax]|uniref:Uncharacterized conserved protein UCP07580 n=1 Tax=Pseudofrankia inefficax (strain DSM 45817 / CECT 9037 / DDB 130130 / EuI1c) TaxID=298654 RepID=E3IWH0_PSEI1|nr:metal-dependent hydrolase [Pseudofrankia inefficax]ADP80153.1 Uncharacterized conserved protein UCP07580 [Pseudofrankia inefficax]
MTDLQVRRIPFDFSQDVSFVWNPANPEFSALMNLTSFMAIAFEKYIVTAVHAAQPRLRGETVKVEADSFLRQEAQHAAAHRLHAKALIRAYPGLAQVLNDLIASYDDLFQARPLEFHLAYVADVEATFTAYFKLLLDYEQDLFAPGDERVASLFLWHFVEEVEHRSSALALYREVVPDPRYRLRCLPAVVRHVVATGRIAIDGFRKHVPFEDRLVDYGGAGGGASLGRLLKRAEGRIRRQPVEKRPAALACVPRSRRWATTRALWASQRPSHDPEHQPLPVFADEWFAAYERGTDVSHWYTSQSAR